MSQQKREYCISHASTWSVPNTPRYPVNKPELFPLVSAEMLCYYVYNTPEKGAYYDHRS